MDLKDDKFDSEYRAEDMDLVTNDNLSSQFDEKDRYRLCRAILKFGDFNTRHEDIIEEARLDGRNIPREVIESEYQNIIRRCREAVEARDRQAGVNARKKRRATQKEIEGSAKGLGYIHIGDHPISAAELLTRISLLESLHLAMCSQNPGHREPWRLKPSFRSDWDPATVEAARQKEEEQRQRDAEQGLDIDDPYEGAVLNFIVPEGVKQYTRDAGWEAKISPDGDEVYQWRKLDDPSMLIGIYKYGFGNWTHMKDDIRLGLPFIHKFKYDKVKQRALRMLRHLDAVIHDVQPKGRRGKRRPDDGTGNSLSLYGQDGHMLTPQSHQNPHGMLNLNSLDAQQQQLYIQAASELEPDICRLSTSPCVRWDLTGQPPDVVTELIQSILKGERKLILDMQKVQQAEEWTDEEVINYMRKALPFVGGLIEDVSARASNDFSAKLLTDELWRSLAELINAEPEDLRNAYSIYRSAQDSGHQLEMGADTERSVSIAGTPLAGPLNAPGGAANSVVAGGAANSTIGGFKPIASSAGVSRTPRMTAHHQHSATLLNTPALSFLPNPNFGPSTPALAPLAPLGSGGFATSSGVAASPGITGGTPHIGSLGSANLTPLMRGLGNPSAFSASPLMRHAEFPTSSTGPTSNHMHHHLGGGGAPSSIGLGPSAESVMNGGGGVDFSPIGTGGGDHTGHHHHHHHHQLSAGNTTAVIVPQGNNNSSVERLQQDLTNSEYTRNINNSSNNNNIIPSKAMNSKLLSSDSHHSQNNNLLPALHSQQQHQTPLSTSIPSPHLGAFRLEPAPPPSPSFTSHQSQQQNNHMHMHFSSGSLYTQHNNNNSNGGGIHLTSELNTPQMSPSAILPHNNNNGNSNTMNSGSSNMSPWVGALGTPLFQPRMLSRGSNGAMAASSEFMVHNNSIMGNNNPTYASNSILSTPNTLLPSSAPHSFSNNNLKTPHHAHLIMPPPASMSSTSNNNSHHHGGLMVGNFPSVSLGASSLHHPYASQAHLSQKKQSSSLTASEISGLNHGVMGARQKSEGDAVHDVGSQQEQSEFVTSSRSNLSLSQQHNQQTQQQLDHQPQVLPSSPFTNQQQQQQ